MYGVDIFVVFVIYLNVVKKDVYFLNDKWIYLWNKIDMNLGMVIVNVFIGLFFVFVWKDSFFRDDILFLVDYKYILFDLFFFNNVLNDFFFVDILFFVILVVFCMLFVLRSIGL